MKGTQRPQVPHQPHGGVGAPPATLSAHEGPLRGAETDRKEEPPHPSDAQRHWGSGFLPHGRPGSRAWRVLAHRPLSLSVAAPSTTGTLNSGVPSTLPPLLPSSSCFSFRKSFLRPPPTVKEDPACPQRRLRGLSPATPRPVHPHLPSGWTAGAQGRGQNSYSSSIRG